MGTRSTALLRTAIIAGAIATAAQFVPLQVARNPASDPRLSFTAQVRATPAVSALLRRACMDCHSNETRWPWYARIAPLSHLLASDVAGARAAMNLSEWGARFPKPAASASMLSVLCADVQSGHMPKERYLMLHPGARLTDAERQDFCEWTHTEVVRLLSRKREVLQPVSAVK